MGRKSKKQHLIEMIERTNFDEINWVDHKDTVIASKDDLELLYGKRFYKKIMNKIEGKRTFFDWLFDR